MSDYLNDYARALEESDDRSREHRRVFFDDKPKTKLALQTVFGVDFETLIQFQSPSQVLRSACLEAFEDGVDPEGITGSVLRQQLKAINEDGAWLLL